MPILIRLVLVLSPTLLIGSVMAQGMSVEVNVLLNYPQSPDFTDPDLGLSRGAAIQFAFGGYFKVSDKRIYPGVRAIGSSVEWQSPAIQAVSSTYGALASTRIFPFDMEGNCDCLSWKDEAGFFFSTFFLDFAAGLGFRVTETDTSFEFTSTNDLAPLAQLRGGFEADIHEDFKLYIAGGWQLGDRPGLRWSTPLGMGVNIRL